jgi:NAD(P)-dependent dehydrogenase (short-subunit alcohol dehydrogenase family)
MAKAFLEQDCAVTISGRSVEAAQKAAQSLAGLYGAERVLSMGCDVSRFEQVQALWDAAVARFGRVDIWINNAGVAHGQTTLFSQPPSEMRASVETNILGTLYGTRVALAGMKGQGGGALYNMEGLGSTGRQVEGMAVYGATKAALAYFNRALAKEVEGTGIITGALRPGMVVTDLLTVQRNSDPAVWERQKRIFNILADRVETVAPWLAKQILANTKNGAVINWVKGGKMMARFLTAPLVKRRVID